MAIPAGIRRCAINVVTPEELTTRSSIWIDRGLSMLPLEVQDLSPAGQIEDSGQKTGTSFGFRVVVGVFADVRAFKTAWDAADQEQIGSLLGYPGCCLRFFHQAWVEDCFIDTTWPMAVVTAGAQNGTRLVEVEGLPECNILWRWLGIRAVPHPPCRFDCAATAEFGSRLMKAGREAGYNEEMDWLCEILSWNIEWSALHGIAEIKTPILKVSTRTDSTPVKYVVRRRGGNYPAEGARGLDFPYQTPAHPLLTGLSSFKKGREPLSDV
jgi:hypothetical protein